MKVADLFVNIALKGADTVGKGLGFASKGMKDLVSTSLEAKVAVAGVIYGLERLTGWASQAGMDLTKFSTVTGLSAQELQKWQYMANKYDVTAEEMSTTIRNLQNELVNIATGASSGEGFGRLGIDITKAKDAFDVFQQLTEKAKTGNPAIMSNLMKSAGISDNMFQMMRMVNFERDKMSKNFGISDKEIDQLTRVNKQWKDFWYTLRSFGLHAVAKEGSLAVKELSESFKYLLRGIDYVTKLEKQFHGLKFAIGAIGVVLALAFAPMATIISGIILLMAELQKRKEGKENLIDKGLDAVKGKKDYGWNTFLANV